MKIKFILFGLFFALSIIKIDSKTTAITRKKATTKKSTTKAKTTKKTTTNAMTSTAMKAVIAINPFTFTNQIAPTITIAPSFLNIWASPSLYSSLFNFIIFIIFIKIFFAYSYPLIYYY